MNKERQRLPQGHLTRLIIKGAMAVHGALGPGFLESVYQNALVHELRKLRLSVACQQRIQVHYDDVIVGDFIVDMLNPFNPIEKSVSEKNIGRDWGLSLGLAIARERQSASKCHLASSGTSHEFR